MPSALTLTDTEFSSYGAVFSKRFTSHAIEEKVSFPNLTFSRGGDFMGAIHYKKIYGKIIAVLH